MIHVFKSIRFGTKLKTDNCKDALIAVVGPGKWKRTAKFALNEAICRNFTNGTETFTLVEGEFEDVEGLKPSGPCVRIYPQFTEAYIAKCNLMITLASPITDDYGILYFNPDTNTAYWSGGDGLDSDSFDVIKTQLGAIMPITIEAEASPEDENFFCVGTVAKGTDSEDE